MVVATLPSTRLLSPHDVERFYGLTVVRLHEWRARGGGPAWHKIGRSVFYRVDELETFVAATAVAPQQEPSGKRLRPSESQQLEPDAALGADLRAQFPTLASGRDTLFSALIDAVTASHD